MSKQIKAKPMNRDRRPARDVLLAGIGAVSLLRKNAGSALTEAAAIAGRMPEAGSIMIEGIGERSKAMLDEVGTRGNYFRWEFVRLLREIGKTTSATTSKLASDVESRVQPLLSRLGDVKVGLGIVVTKPKAKRAAARKSTRKSAKPAAKRAGRKARKAA